ncbi:class I SAM-dependent methyltransferase [Microcella sp.]|uniref:class I SAM-dependent methyltransferase n=1 Tax=Microcella sp. TaxID=1913979 RepID=UPI0025608A47|nr:class I SAM-dependent methyltransferase [Microcella sp.]MBX9472589.1 class I SAM-dependent methyltransferase [Microcella sp.]
MAEGRVTRGTTGVNRLRRMDRWLAAHPVLRRAADPLIVDLGYGAAHWTSLELLERLRRVRPEARVVGIEIDPERVRAAAPFAREGLTFRQGGFEIPLEGDGRPAIIRAANVLRQYDEGEVPEAWALLRSRLQPAGVLLEGTCSELGRVASWVALDPDGPRTLTLALHLGSVEHPSVVAERLPKVLIHRNVPGEGVHDLLRELDAQWARHAPLATFSPRQRFIAAVRGLRDAGWPVHDGVARWRLGELTVDWSAVAPRP